MNTNTQDNRVQNKDSNILCSNKNETDRGTLVYLVGTISNHVLKGTRPIPSELYLAKAYHPNYKETTRLEAAIRLLFYSFNEEDQEEIKILFEKYELVLACVSEGV